MKKTMIAALVAIITSAVLISGCAPSGGDGDVVNVYSSRHYDTDDALYAEFTEATGIRVNLVKGSADELIERLRTEGTDTEADVFMTADVGRLHRAKTLDLLQPADSAVLSESIPAHLRDDEGHWFGLTMRARVIVYAKDRVDPASISTYADLTDAKWQGRVLTRSSDSVYNQTLLSSFIELLGEDAARTWAEGIVGNLAREPIGGDRDQAKAVASGEGDVAIMNTYYLGLMMHSSDPEDVKVAESVGVIFPDQNGAGTHINVSGAGVVKGSRNADNARRFLEFLASERAQRQFAETNFEYPVLEGVESAEYLRNLGDFKAQTMSLSRLGELNETATRLFTEAGWR